MEIIELSAIPGALEETKRKAKKSKKHYKKVKDFKRRGDISLGITSDFKANHIIPEKLKIKKSWFKIPRFDGACIDFTDDGFDLRVSFR